MMKAFLFLLLPFVVSICNAFTAFGIHRRQFGSTGYRTTTTVVRFSNPDDNNEETHTAVAATEDEDGSDDIQELELILEKHKPLGCTVEESLAEGDEEFGGGGKPVFVSRVTQGGNADVAGLKVGDVIVGLTGVFDEIEDVGGAGLQRVKSLVNALPPNQPLTIQIQRNTNIQSKHEQVLLELCTLPVSTDDDLESCLTSIMMGDSDLTAPSSSPKIACLDDETECMLETMFQAWGEELPQGTTEPEVEEIREETKKVMPWSSRSSPSGTYVRDPVTGQLKNIDADDDVSYE